MATGTNLYKGKDEETAESRSTERVEEVDTVGLLE